MTFTERIDFVLNTQQLKRVSLCEAVGINTTSVAAWKKRGTIPGGDICFKVADFLGVDCRWLVTGQQAQSVELNQEEKELLEMWEDLSPSDREEILMLMAFKNGADKEKLSKADNLG